jgi:hypothetical protein
MLRSPKVNFSKQKVKEKNRECAAGYRECSSKARAEVVAACDIDESELKYVKNAFGVEHLYKDYRDLIARSDIDAVVVATPNYLHHQMTVDALREGKHVLCEKPPALTARQVKEMFDASRSARAAVRRRDASALTLLYMRAPTYWETRLVPAVVSMFTSAVKANVTGNTCLGTAIATSL